MEPVIPKNQHVITAAASARACLNTVAKKLRVTWPLVNQILQNRGRGDIRNWPEPCFLPRLLWESILPADLPCTELERRLLVRTLAAVGAWRYTQGVYQFDPTAYEAVCATPLKGEFGEKNVEAPPDYCSYVVTRGLMIGTVLVRGAFVYQNFDFKLNLRVLCIVLDLEGQYFTFDIALDSSTFKEALRDATAHQMQTNAPDFLSALMASGPNTATELRGAVEAVVSLYLYLCAENADIGGGSERPAKPQPKRIKGGYRMFPPDNPKVWDVGSRVGAKLRASRAWVTQVAANDEEGTHAGPRPHFRRAHWHHYWIGPLNSENRKSVLRWVHQCLVNCESPEMLVPTVRPVESANDQHPRAA